LILNCVGGQLHAWADNNNMAVIKQNTSLIKLTRQDVQRRSIHGRPGRGDRRTTTRWERGRTGWRGGGEPRGRCRCVVESQGGRQRGPAYGHVAHTCKRRSAAAPAQQLSSLSSASQHSALSPRHYSISPFSPFLFAFFFF